MMEPCKKQQKIVKRPGNEVRFRCMNNKCSFLGNIVDEDICSRCPVRVEAYKRRCPDRHQQTKSNAIVVSPEEMLNISDTEVREMITDAGFDVEEFERGPTPEGEVPNYPPLSMQAWFYKEALIRWNKAGRPKRSDEEVKEILDAYCKPVGGPVCPWYDSEQGRCKGCGCFISEGSIAIFNKIRMGTEHCPQEKW